MAEFARWVADLDATFAFLLILPFVIGIVAVVADVLRTRSRVQNRPGEREAALGRRLEPSNG